MPPRVERQLPIGDGGVAQRGITQNLDGLACDRKRHDGSANESLLRATIDHLAAEAEQDGDEKSREANNAASWIGAAFGAHGRRFGGTVKSSAGRLAVEGSKAGCRGIGNLKSVRGVEKITRAGGVRQVDLAVGASDILAARVCKAGGGFAAGQRNPVTI